MCSDGLVEELAFCTKTASGVGVGGVGGQGHVPLDNGVGYAWRGGVVVIVESNQFRMRGKEAIHSPPSSVHDRNLEETDMQHISSSEPAKHSTSRHLAAGELTIGGYCSYGPSLTGALEKDNAQDTWEVRDFPLADQGQHALLYFLLDYYDCFPETTVPPGWRFACLRPKIAGMATGDFATPITCLITSMCKALELVCSLYIGNWSHRIPSRFPILLWRNNKEKNVLQDSNRKPRSLKVMTWRHWAIKASPVVATQCRGTEMFTPQLACALYATFPLRFRPQLCTCTPAQLRSPDFDRQSRRLCNDEQSSHVDIRHFVAPGGQNLLTAVYCSHPWAGSARGYRGTQLPHAPLGAPTHARCVAERVRASPPPHHYQQGEQVLPASSKHPGARARPCSALGQAARSAHHVGGTWVRARGAGEMSRVRRAASANSSSTRCGAAVISRHLAEVTSRITSPEVSSTRGVVLFHPLSEAQPRQRLFQSVTIVSNDATSQRVFSGISRFPALAFRRCSIFSSFHPYRLSRPRCLGSSKSFNSFQLNLAMGCKEGLRGFVSAGNENDLEGSRRPSCPFLYSSSAGTEGTAMRRQTSTAWQEHPATNRAFTNHTELSLPPQRRVFLRWEPTGIDCRTARTQATRVSISDTPGSHSRGYVLSPDWMRSGNGDYLYGFSTSQAEKCRSDKADTATRNKCAIASMRRALNWRKCSRHAMRLQAVSASFYRLFTIKEPLLKAVLKIYLYAHCALLCLIHVLWTSSWCEEEEGEGGREKWVASGALRSRSHARYFRALGRREGVGGLTGPPQGLFKGKEEPAIRGIRGTQSSITTRTRVPAGSAATSSTVRCFRTLTSAGRVANTLLLRNPRRKKSRAYKSSNLAGQGMLPNMGSMRR
ncbi:hypothetical protein PR048_019322 [Dryococelus australis]|uniref:Uncharacterized protein n=1 Tax=Dryococelus australis TaxID=614101 RepID=A0ABQ9H3H8_9NEOP|nr:hypothetical protein PR048_019322 [Dryococelus australis]